MAQFEKSTATVFILLLVRIWGQWRICSALTKQSLLTTARVGIAFAVPAFLHYGSPTAQQSISQTVQVSGSADDCFVFAGWAKGNAAPLWDKAHETTTRQFAIQLKFNYTDGSAATPFTAQFNPNSNEWQYVAAAAVAEKAYSSVTIRLVYDYNVNTVCFDGIQLFKEQFGTSYAYDENGNVTSVMDLQKQTTTYEYDANNNLTEVIQDNKAKMTYTYDEYHNVLTATSEEGLVYTFVYDTWGNNTSVSIGSGDTKISSSAVYTDPCHLFLYPGRQQLPFFP